MPIRKVHHPAAAWALASSAVLGGERWVTFHRRWVSPAVRLPAGCRGGCRPGAARSSRPAKLPIMQTLVVDHPLIAHKLTTLRDESTEAPTFRRLTDELVTLLAYEATREITVQPVVVRTPVGEAQESSWPVRRRWWCRCCGPASACSTG